MNYINPSIGDLNALGLKNAQNYAGADPYPNACFDDFFDPAILQTVLQEFPDMSRKTDSHFNDLNQNKLASRGEGRFGPVTREFMRYLNSQPSQLQSTLPCVLTKRLLWDRARHSLLVELN